MKRTPLPGMLSDGEDITRTHVLREGRITPETGRPSSTRRELCVSAVEEALLPSPGSVEV